MFYHVFLPTKDPEVPVVLFSLAETMLGSKPEYDWLNNLLNCITNDNVNIFGLAIMLI